MRRPDPGNVNGPVDRPFSDAPFKDDYPTLYDYLFCVAWEDGKPRTTSTLLFFVEGGALKCCINDRDNNRSAFVSEVRFHDLLSLIEAKLATEQMDWKAKGQRPQANGYTPF